MRIMLFKNLTREDGADFTIHPDAVIGHCGYPKDRDILVQVIVPEGEKATDKQREVAEVLCCHLLDVYGLEDNSLVFVGENGAL